jgi:hypothetical protein
MRDDSGPDLSLTFEDLERMHRPLVYLWRRGTQALYVGMSWQGLVRPLAPSHEKLRDFQLGDELHVWYNSAPLELEAELIHRLQPLYNGRPRPCPDCGGRLFKRNLAAGRCDLCQRRARHGVPPLLATQV